MIILMITVYTFTFYCQVGCSERDLAALSGIQVGARGN